MSAARGDPPGSSRNKLGKASPAERTSFALGDRPPVGPALGAIGDEAAPAAAVAGDPAVGAIGRIRDAGGERRQRRAARQQPEQRRKGGAGGADAAALLHQVPRGHPLADRYLREQPVGLVAVRAGRASAPGADPRRGPCPGTSGRSRSRGRRGWSRSASGGLVSGIVATTTLWEEIVDAIQAVNSGPHAGHRAVHAKGTVCSGTFTSTPEASRLSRAAHLQGDPVDATVRFSNASGNPSTSDAHVLAGRGMAVKFHLPDGEATDIVSVPLVVFFVRTPEDFLEFTRARIPDPETGQPDPEKLSAFLARASRDRRRAPEGHPQARPDHQLRHLRLPRAPRVRPGRRRRREALGPLHLGAGGGDRVPDRRGSATRRTPTTCRTRSGSG